MIAHLLPPLESSETAADARAREVAALQAAWAELDEAHRYLTQKKVGPGSLVERIRAALQPEPPTSVSAWEVLEHLRGCSLTARQLRGDLGHPEATLRDALHQLLGLRLVRRERYGKVWVYHVTPEGRRALRGGR